MKTRDSKNTIAISISIAVVMLATFTAVSYLGCSTAKAITCSTSSPTTVSVKGSQLADNYYEFSEANLYQAQQQGKTVLYFWAPWCATCSSLDLELQEGKTSLPNGITLLRVPYDEASDLKQKYAVTMQHTFVQVDHEGNLVTSWVGGSIVDFSRYIR